MKNGKKVLKKNHFVDEQSDLSLFNYLILAFVIIMPLLFCKWNDQSPFEMIKAYFSGVSITAFFAYFIYKLINQSTIKIKINFWFYGLIIYLFVYTLSFAFSNFHYGSIWGVLNLPAGSMMTIWAFVALSLIVMNEFENRGQTEKLAKAFVLMAFIMAIYGIIQHFGGDPINWWAYSAMNTRALSTMGQSVGYGTVVGCCLPLCFAFLITSGSRNQFIFWACAWFSMCLGVLYSGSRLPIFGFYITMLIFLIVLGVFYKKIKFINYKKILISILVAVLASCIYYFEPGANAIKEKIDPGQIKNGYSTRFIVWDTAVQIWKKYPILGTGPEVFGEEFNHMQTVEQNYAESWRLIWHKAHNEFVHYLATTGTLGILAYLSLIFLMFIPTVRILKLPEWNKYHIYSVALLGGFGFLLLTHMTAFSFIPTLMIFYIFPAMNYKFFGQDKEIVLNNLLSQRLKWMLSAFVIVSSFLVIHKIYSVWKADVLYNDSRRLLVGAGNVDGAKELLDEAQKNNPDNAEYWCFRSDIYYNLLVRSFKTQTDAAVPLRREYFKEVVSSSDKCLTLDDRKSDLWRARGTLFMSLSQIDPKAIEVSLQAYKKAVEVYPSNPFTQLNLASVYRRMNRTDLAIESLRKALSLRNDMVPAFAELMIIYYSEKKPEAIRSLVEEIRALKMKENESEFYPDLKGLVKIAQDNQYTVTAQILSQLY